MVVIGALAAGASLFCTYVVPYRGAVGPEPKLMVIAFGGLALWFVGRRSWRLAGLNAALAFLTWQPAAVYIVAVLLATRARGVAVPRRALAWAAVGVAVPVAAVLCYLWLSSALAAAYRQAVLNMFSVGATTLVSQSLWVTLRTNVLGIWHVARPALAHQKVLFPLGAAGWVLFALAEPVWQGLRKDAPAGVRQAIRRVFSSPERVAFIVTGFGFVGFSLFDFQGQPDLIPLLPLMAWGIGGLVVLILDRMAPLQQETVTALIGLAVAALLIVWGMRDNRIVAHPRFSLQSQIELTDAVTARFGRDTPVQVVGCLAPLVLSGRVNATPLTHLGPRFVPIVEQEMGDLASVAALLTDRGVPVIILCGTWEGNKKLSGLLEGRYFRQELDLPFCGSWYPCEVLQQKQ